MASRCLIETLRDKRGISEMEGRQKCSKFVPGTRRARPGHVGAGVEHEA